MADLSLLKEFRNKLNELYDNINTCYSILEMLEAKCGMTIEGKHTINKELIPKDTIFNVDSKNKYFSHYIKAKDEMWFYKFGSSLTDKEITHSKSYHIIDNPVINYSMILFNSHPISSPISNGINVEITLRNGEIRQTDEAETFMWDHQNDGEDIMAYRILQTYFKDFI
ncbi:MAG: hypothetical protein DRG78_16010 [Epsilonproteobacteria bacterium]|nr:MAG: hypothetical protein DRG78_16010 [Campylobacterota bacterium]